MKTIAVLGLGNMGFNIAANILKAGYELRVYNRSKGRDGELVKQGAKNAASPADAVRGADAVVSVVGDDEASKAIWLGEQGALAATSPGCCIIECSTLSLGWVKELSALAQERRCRFADAGLGGGPGSIPGGTMNLFVGAEQATFDAIKPLLASFSKRQFRFGLPGAGMAYKLINNMLIDVQVSALAEALAMMEKSGIDMAEAEKAMMNGSFSSPAVTSNLKGMLAASYEPVSFQLRWMRKDADYMHRFAEERGVKLPVAAAARGLLEEAAAKGWSSRNWTVIAELYRGR
ncbi:MAG TPA: NAD(P)-dependent oxidoreductase [Spirochaetales bacterium]|jgi:3-hydroxyisobutyrate dehydrogenase|nr:NAD(P)-dependent oxidoreductase [Spirochaetales bacterium]